MTARTIPWALLAAMAVLTACGGGGGGGSTGSVMKLEGAYQGATGNGKVVSSLTLENGDSWILYGVQKDNAIAVESMVYATDGRSDGSTYTATTRDYWSNGEVHLGNLSSSYEQGRRMNGTIDSAGVKTLFIANAILANDYNYQTPASLDRIKGAWSGTLLDGTNGQVSIDATGKLQGSFEGCNVAGQVQPRTSGKNVFDITIDFGTTPCTLPGQRATGVAVNYGLPGNAAQLIIIGTTANNAAGTAFLSIR